MKDFFEPRLPSGWKWTSTWTTDKCQFVDNDGWAYGPDFNSLKWPPTSSKSCTKSAVDVVRRRRLIRTRKKSPEQGVNSVKSVFTTISPGASDVLPWRSTSNDSDQCLEVRPCVDHPEPAYSWGCPVAVGSGYLYGKDEPFMDQGSLYSQKQETKMPSFAFKLNQLEKKDIILRCSSTGSRQCWLSIGADASILHTELNSPVYDWRISVNSPLKLENRLPCPAEFTIWEKASEGSCIERQHGIISSRRSAHIYSADIQKPIYLTLFVQGGWVLEKVITWSKYASTCFLCLKNLTYEIFTFDNHFPFSFIYLFFWQDPILILDLSSINHVSSFWMVHQQTKRFVIPKLTFFLVYKGCTRSMHSSSQVS